MAHTVEILSVGTELLLGNIANTDAQMLSQGLSALGLNVYWHTVVGDNPQRAKEAVELARKRADIIITTGGLGPTCDDLTKNVLAEAFGKKLVYDVSPKVRLVESSDFAADNFTFLKGFISGMYASNYDLTHVFIDSLCRIIPSEPDSPEVEEFLAWLDRFSDTNKVKFTITISADIALATEAIKAYF